MTILVGVFMNDFFPMRNIFKNRQINEKENFQHLPTCMTITLLYQNIF